MSDFDHFWQWYPRKICKQEARKSFEKAAKRATPEQILNGVKGLAKDWRGKRKEDLSYCPHASTWLNNDRWENYQTIPEVTTVKAPVQLRSHGLSEQQRERARIVQQQVIGVIGEDYYREWFADLTVTQADDGTFQYRAPTKFTADHVRDHYGHLLERCWKPEPVEVVV